MVEGVGRIQASVSVWSHECREPWVVLEYYVASLGFSITSREDWMEYGLMHDLLAIEVGVARPWSLRA